VSAELCYYNARYYDPELSRFIQPDTIADLDDPQTLNCYSYVNNNPLNSTDPTGHEVSHNDAFDAKVLSIDGGTTQKEIGGAQKGAGGATRAPRLPLQGAKRPRVFRTGAPA